MAVLFLFYLIPCYSQTTAVHLNQLNLDKGVAISGYDPVAYFTQGRALKGKKDISYSLQGVEYRFASTDDEQLFRANPGKYEPQYGGWCAYAMGHDGSRVEVDPETFKVVDGKLFLFYNRFFNNTLKSWNQDESRLHAQADANWKRFLQQ